MRIISSVLAATFLSCATPVPKPNPKPAPKSYPRPYPLDLHSPLLNPTFPELEAFPGTERSYDGNLEELARDTVYQVFSLGESSENISLSRALIARLGQVALGNAEALPSVECYGYGIFRRNAEVELNRPYWEIEQSSHLLKELAKAMDYCGGAL